MYATLHNAMATFEDGFLFGPNHQSSLEGALEAGYRGLNLDICNCGGEIVFCHGICALGPRDVVDVMFNVNQFLDKNPTETIIFIYQVDDEVDQKVDLNQFYDQMLLVDGLVEKLYVHNGPDTAWPTLRELTNPAFNKVKKNKCTPLKYRPSFFRFDKLSVRKHKPDCFALLLFAANHYVSLQRSRLQR